MSGQDHFIHGMNTASYVFGAFSMCGSLAVLLTGYLFRPLRREIFFQLIWFTSACDFMFSISAAWGPNKSIQQCVVQGIFQGYFILASVLFVLLLNFTMFCRLQFQKQYISLLQMCLIGLGIPCILICIPLSDKHLSYYDIYNYERDQICTLSVTNHHITSDGETVKYVVRTYQNWYDGVYTYPLSCFVGLMIVLCSVLYLYTVPNIRRNDHKRAERVLKLVNYISLYPLAIIILVGPFQIFFIAITQLGYDIADLPTPTFRALYIFFVVRYMFGLVGSIIFFTNSSAANQYWKVWFVRNIGHYFGFEEENQLLRNLSPEEISEMGISMPQSMKSSIRTRTSIQTRFSLQIGDDRDLITIGDYEDDDYEDFDNNDDDDDLEMALAMTFFNPVAIAKRKVRRPSGRSNKSSGRIEEEGSAELGIVIEKESAVNPLGQRSLEANLRVMNEWDAANEEAL